MRSHHAVFALLLLTVLRALPVVAQEPTPPTPPSALTATAVDCRNVHLAWTTPTSSGSHSLLAYKILRNGMFLKWVYAPATTATDSSVSAATTYAYSVVALNWGRRLSPPSPTATVTTPSCSGTPPDDAPPVADAGPNQLAQTLVSLTFSASGSFDPDGRIESYQWTFGDGRTATGQIVSHTYVAAGTYTVRLTVTDDAGQIDTDTASVQISNRAPVANAGPDQTSLSGAVVRFDGSGSRDSDGTIVRYAWDFGDGGTASGSIVQHVYLQQGNYTAKLTVTDDQGALASDTARITVRPPNESERDGGTVLWARQFGDTGNDYGYATTIDSQGNILITGRVIGTVDLGGSTPCTETIMLAKYTAAGDLLWSRCFGGRGHGAGYGIATDPDDNVLVTGNFIGMVDFGGGPRTSAGGFDIFVAKYAADGEHLWSHAFGSDRLNALPSETGSAIASDPSGNVIVTGTFEGTINFGGGSLTNAARDIFLVSFTPAGTHRWSKRFGGPYLSNFGNAVATDRRGNILLTGSFRGTVDFGGGPVASTSGAAAFLAQFSSTGAYRWVRKASGTGDAGTGVAVDAADNVILTGTFTESVDLGGGLLTSAGAYDIFLAQYSSTGAHRWSKRFGGPSGYDEATAVAVDAANNVFVTGTFSGSVDFGGGPLAGNGTEVFVAKYSPTGAHWWSTALGGFFQQQGRGIAVSDRSIAVTGNFYRWATFDDIAFTGAGSDGFLLCLEP